MDNLSWVARWTCPKDFGCPSGACGGSESSDHWQQWVAAHNIYRCMHDAPPVVWSPEVYADAASTFEYQEARVGHPSTAHFRTM